MAITRRAVWLAALGTAVAAALLAAAGATAVSPIAVDELLPAALGEIQHG